MLVVRQADFHSADEGSSPSGFTKNSSKIIMNKEEIVLKSLIENGVIPDQGLFQINEYHLKMYLDRYHSLFGSYQKRCGKLSNIRFARRLAGRTFLKVNFDRGARFHDIKAGLVYLISNEAFPDFVKVGMTINIKQRLEVYQTYDPYRRFKIEKYDFVLDRSSKEKEFLTHSNIYNESGEWVSLENSIEIFQRLISYIPS